METSVTGSCSTSSRRSNRASSTIARTAHAGAIQPSGAGSFRRPVRIGDEVTAEVKVSAIDPARGRVTLATQCVVAGKTVVEGEAVVIVPRRAA